MGICKCKKKSEEFCYNHKKFICDGCVLPEHNVCHIDTYVNWLTNSDYQSPLCEICKSDLTSDNSVRLTCYHVFHPECIDVYANSLPPNTAAAGYTCPKCSTPIIPADSDNSPLAFNIKSTFSISPWAEIILGAFKSSIAEKRLGSSGEIANGNGQMSEYYNMGASERTPLSPSLLEDSQPLAHLASNPYGVAIRKQQMLQQATPVNLNNEESSGGHHHHYSGGDSVIQFADSVTNGGMNSEDDFYDDKYNKKPSFTHYYQNHILPLREKPLKLIITVVVILFLIYLIFKSDEPIQSTEQNQPIIEQAK